MKYNFAQYKDKLQERLQIPYLLVLAAVVLAKITDSEILTITIFFALLIIYAIRKYDSRIPIAFALILLILSAIELAMKSEDAANQIAIYAYYYLVVGVILQLIEYIKIPMPAGRKCSPTRMPSGGLRQAIP